MEEKVLRRKVGKEQQKMEEKEIGKVWLKEDMRELKNKRGQESEY